MVHASNESKSRYCTKFQEQRTTTLGLDKPWLVLHSPCVEGLPKLRDDRLIDVPPVRVDLQLGDVPVFDLRVWRVACK